MKPILFKPYSVLRELSHGSHPDGEVSPLLSLYWLTWLVGGWVGVIVARALTSVDDVGDLIIGDYMAIASSLILLVAAGLILRLSRQITSNQDTKHQLEASK